MPPPLEIDLPTFLYLNPELPAYSNVRTVEQALLGFDSFGPLPWKMPALPHGFDARVYLSAQHDTSGLNAAIGRAMVNEGMSPVAVQRRGVYVGTLMQNAVLTAPNTFRVDQPQAVITSSNLQQGDDVKVMRARGDAMYGTVTDVDYTASTFSLSNPVYAFADPNSVYTVFGIKIADPDRQARVAFARNAAAATSTELDDTVPRPEFNVGMYRTMYPNTRGFSYPDTYIDYRTRWKRDDEYRIIKGRDIFNLSAPYSSNLLNAASTAGGAFDVTGDFSAASNTLIATPSLVTVRSNLSAGSGFLQATPTSFSVDGGNLSMSPGLFAACSNLVVVQGRASTEAFGFRTALIDDTDLRVASSNLVVTPDGVTAAGCNLVVSWGSVSAAAGNLVVSPSNAVLLGPCEMHSSLNVGETIGIGLSNPEGGAGIRLAVAGDIFSTGTLITLSDERSKTSIRPIEDALGKVAKLRGYTFSTYTSANRRHTGLLAQEVERVLPEAVYPATSGFRSIAYGNMAGLLVEAVNALAARVEAIEMCRQHQS